MSSSLVRFERPISLAYSSYQHSIKKSAKKLLTRKIMYANIRPCYRDMM